MDLLFHHRLGLVAGIFRHRALERHGLPEDAVGCGLAIQHLEEIAQKRQPDLVGGTGRIPDFAGGDGGLVHQIVECRPVGRQIAGRAQIGQFAPGHGAQPVEQWRDAGLRGLGRCRGKRLDPARDGGPGRLPQVAPLTLAVSEQVEMPFRLAEEAMHRPRCGGLGLGAFARGSHDPVARQKHLQIDAPARGGAGHVGQQGMKHPVLGAMLAQERRQLRLGGRLDRVGKGRGIELRSPGKTGLDRQHLVSFWWVSSECRPSGDRISRCARAPSG